VTTGVYGTREVLTTVVSPFEQVGQVSVRIRVSVSKLVTTRVRGIEMG